MANVSFSHPLVDRLLGPLHINTNPDQITWAYGLNTASYPTYGGEVVQILSVYFDDMTVAGTVASYDELELIYGWFIAYMQYATQGRDNPSFDQHPVTFTYPERGWTFQIWPKTLPGFRYGRDVVAPTWTMLAAVKEPDATFAQQIQHYAAYNASKTGQLYQFGKATADFGKTGDLTSNPWASPDADPTLKGQTMAQYLSKHTQQLADTFSAFVSDYQTSNLTQLPEFSRPPNAAAQLGGGKTTKKAKVKK